MGMGKIQFFVIAGVFTFISGCGWSPSAEETAMAEPSAEETAMAEKACIKLIDDSMEIYTTNNFPNAVPKIFDTYTKNGKIVMEIGYKVVQSGGSTKPYSVRLCVVDLEKGTVALPSPFNFSEWRK